MTICNSNPQTVLKNANEREILKVVELQKISHVPVISTDKTIIGLYTTFQFNSTKNLPNRMIIIAGGRGRRLGTFTENCPKPMIEVAGKPILQHVIEQAVKEGITKFTITLHFLPEVIVDYFGDGSKFDVEIEYVRENEPLGTAGSLSLLKRDHFKN